jgi:hypothetical protein
MSIVTYSAVCFEFESKSRSALAQIFLQDDS